MAYYSPVLFPCSSIGRSARLLTERFLVRIQRGELKERIEMEKLVKCPFCKFTKPEIAYDTEAFVYCPNCGASGPVYPLPKWRQQYADWRDRELAIESWNKSEK